MVKRGKMHLDNWLKLKVEQREAKNLLRKLNSFENKIDFSSNDYLGLARSKEIFQATHRKLIDLNQQKNGSTGSRLLSGNSILAEELEKKLAGIFLAEDTLLFNSGYTANLAVLSSLPQRGDTIIYDELAHACMKDGARLSLANHFSFKHNDLNDLELKLTKAKGKIFIAIESIYSMDGDESPLKEIVELSEKYNASIVLDEAHSTGIYGQFGNGIACSHQLENRIAVRIYTFGKAMGAHGACIAGSNILKQYLINFARPFIYTTALPPHSIITIDQAFEYLRYNDEAPSVLHSRISYFMHQTKSLNSVKKESKSPIQTIIIPGNDKVKSIANSLLNEGLDCRPILSPTVPEGKERIRICLHSFNTLEEINLLTQSLNKLL